MFTFWKYYILKLLRLETITLSDAMLSDINVVLCYVLLQSVVWNRTRNRNRRNRDFLTSGTETGTVTC